MKNSNIPIFYTSRVIFWVKTVKITIISTNWQRQVSKSGTFLSILWMPYFIISMLFSIQIGDIQVCQLLFKVLECDKVPYLREINTNLETYFSEYIRYSLPTNLDNQGFNHFKGKWTKIYNFLWIHKYTGWAVSQIIRIIKCLLT